MRAYNTQIRRTMFEEEFRWMLDTIDNIMKKGNSPEIQMKEIQKFSAEKLALFLRARRIYHSLIQSPSQIPHFEKSEMTKNGDIITTIHFRSTLTSDELQYFFPGRWRRFQEKMARIKKANKQRKKEMKWDKIVRVCNKKKGG
jgi:hypothetical protein